ncbi:MAG: hypothetical protein JXR68_13405 [Bacteroidales bacterium]|nr:hypothetical protein [Bacteroidales bacterium]
MKDNKITQIFLIIVVVIVWGLIMVRVIGNFSSEESSIENNSSVSFPDIDQEEDTSKLLLNYNDPFLEHIDIVSSQNTKIRLPKTTTVDSNKRFQKSFPKIKYYGLITNKKTLKLVAILNIDGEQYLVQQGQEIFGIKLLEMQNDSILINYENEKKWICK